MLNQTRNLIYNLEIYRKHFEQRSNEFVTRLKLTESSSKTLACILNYLYTRDLVINDRRHRLKDLVVCARELDIQGGKLFENLASYLTHRLDRYDILELFDLSRLLNQKPLYDHTFSRIIKQLLNGNFSKLIHLDSFLELTMASVYEFVRIVVGNYAPTQNELSKLTNRVVLWVRLNRKQLEYYSSRAERRMVLMGLFEKLQLQPADWTQLEAMFKF